MLSTTFGDFTNIGNVNSYFRSIYVEFQTIVLNLTLSWAWKRL
jgi:hypothetical protein